MTIPTASTRALYFALALVTPLLASPALAGTPYASDDPAPTQTGQWEIYSFADSTLENGEHSGSFGLDLSYGAAPDLQISAVLPFEFNSASLEGKRFGDAELSVKWRLIDDAANHRALAIAPGIIFPTSADSGKASFLLPVWVQQNFGDWSVYGGGGYLIHPGPGNRDSWQQGLVIANQLSEGVQLGAELFHQGAETEGGNGLTAIRTGAIASLGGPLTLTLSAGPLIEDNTGSTSVSVFAAILATF